MGSRDEVGTARHCRAAVGSDGVGIGEASTRRPFGGEAGQQSHKPALADLVLAPTELVRFGHDATHTAPRGAVDVHVQDDAVHLGSTELVGQIDKGEFVASVKDLDEVLH